VYKDTKKAFSSNRKQALSQAVNLGKFPAVWSALFLGQNFVGTPN
jgi:hypothetical protein